jgi:hypothetical protein
MRGAGSLPAPHSGNLAGTSAAPGNRRRAVPWAVASGRRLQRNPMHPSIAAQRERIVALCRRRLLRESALVLGAS